jgi:hypothetical protein
MDSQLGKGLLTGYSSREVTEYAWFRRVGPKPQSFETINSAYVARARPGVALLIRGVFAILAAENRHGDLENVNDSSKWSMPALLKDAKVYHWKRGEMVFI